MGAVRLDQRMPKLLTSKKHCLKPLILDFILQMPIIIQWDLDYNWLFQTVNNILKSAVQIRTSQSQFLIIKS